MVCSVPLHRAHNERHTAARCAGRLGMVGAAMKPTRSPRRPATDGRREGAAWVQRTCSASRTPTAHLAASFADPLLKTHRLQGEGPSVAAPQESACGPTLPSAAFTGRGSYRGMSCRIRQLSATAESDSSRSAQWQSLYDDDRHAMLARMSRVVGLLFLLETKDLRALSGWVPPLLQ